MKYVFADTNLFFNNVFCMTGLTVNLENWTIHHTYYLKSDKKKCSTGDPCLAIIYLIFLEKQHGFLGSTVAADKDFFNQKVLIFFFYSHHEN